MKHDNRNHIRACLLLALTLSVSGCMRAADGTETAPTPTIAPPMTVDTAAPETAPPAVTTAVRVETVPETTVPETEEPIVIPDDGQIHVMEITLDKYEVHITEGLSDMPWVTMTPADAVDKSELWSSDNPAVATVDDYGRILGVSPGTCTVTVASADIPALKAKIAVTVYAASYPAEPTMVDGILLVNKTYALPADYGTGIDPEAEVALDTMIAAAKQEGITLFLKSGFRSFETQKTLYNNYVARDGKDEADRYSARPGHSEHQTGLAFDLNSLEQSFGETAEGKWLAANCADYGFIIRYPADKEAVTGYMYEPWHVRYLGMDTAKAVYESGLCLEEYLEVESAYAN